MVSKKVDLNAFTTAFPLNGSVYDLPFNDCGGTRSPLWVVTCIFHRTQYLGLHTRDSNNNHIPLLLPIKK